MAKIDPCFWEDLRWGEKHHGELLKEYKDLWVAISEKKVVAAGDHGAEVLAAAQKKTGKEQVPLLYVDCGEHIYGQG